MSGATVRRVTDLAQAEGEIVGQRFIVRPGTKVCEFLLSNRSTDILLGPLGSGKTKALCARVMRHAQEQRPSPLDAIRRTRWALVRNTTPDLKRSTVRTWLETFPEHIYGRMNFGAPMYHRIRFGDVLCETDFIGLDKPEDVRKLRSTEYTGVCFNELPFIPREIFDEADSRLRYPPLEHGGPTWRGILADGNAPDEDHWTALMFGFVPLPPGMSEREVAELTMPEEWGLHIQPPALIERHDVHGRVTGYDVNPAAENLENLPPDYYQRQLRGKTVAWIDSRLMVRVALVVEGDPVWTQFRRDVHVVKEPLKPVPGYDVVIGLDFGRQPAATFQQEVNNRMLLQYELIGLNEGAVTFAPKVKRFLTEKYPNYTFRAYGDPKGADRTQTDERTADD